MTIIIENKKATREGRKGVFSYSTTGRMKTGYLVYDEAQQNIGIVYSCDDDREDKKHRYGMAEIFFDEKYEQEHDRTWKIIKINGDYLPFDELEKIMSKNERYALNID